MPFDLPAGTRIAFAREDTLYVSTYPEGRATMPMGKGQDPTLSGDGSLIAFEESSGGADRHFVIKSVNGAKVVGRHAGTLPYLSPDGKQVVFSRFVGSKWTLWVSDLSLKSPREIGGKAKAAFSFGWTPDGKSVLVYPESTNGSLCVIRPEDGEVVSSLPFTKFAAVDSLAIPLGVSWSGSPSDPIAYESLTEDTHTKEGEPLNGLFLWTGSGKPKRLTTKGMTGSQPRWIDSASGLLAFTGEHIDPKKNAAGQSALYLMDIRSGQIKPILLNVYNASFALPRSR